LVGVGLTDREDLQGIHTDLGVEHLQLAVARVHYEPDTIHCTQKIALYSTHYHTQSCCAKKKKKEKRKKKKEKNMQRPGLELATSWLKSEFNDH
jgi:hypothetical protein